MKSFSNELLINYRNYLKNIFPQTLSYILNGELFIKIPLAKIKHFIFFLNNHTQCQYKILSDICVIDFPWKNNRFEIVYNLLSICFNTRITITTNLKEQDSIESVTSIYNVAGWFEREIWDMFGIPFLNHFDLRRILTDYGFKGHPLRKDFPLTGYTQVRYSFVKKRILVEEVNLTQDYRIFYFNNSWNNII